MAPQGEAGRPEFERATRLERLDSQRFRASIPDGWQQGRGAFGGLVLGLVARAMEEAESQPERRLRTLSGDICGPVAAGEAEIVVRVLRRGANQTNLQADLVQKGETLATATSVLSTARSAQARRFQPPCPVLPSWQEMERLPVEPPIGPVFASHYDYRTAGPFPFSGHEEPVAEGWIREREQLTQVDAPAIIGRLDAWWPAIFSIETEPRMSATISFLAEILADPRTLDPAQPLAYRARAVAHTEGFIVELRELWAGETLVAMNQQTFALIR